MKRAYAYAKSTEADWQEALATGFDLGLPSFFHIEWLIDQVERATWRKIW